MNIRIYLGKEQRMMRSAPSNVKRRLFSPFSYSGGKKKKKELKIKRFNYKKNVKGCLRNN